MRVVLSILVVVALAVIGLAAWVYSGRFDISARQSAGPGLDWLAGMLKRQSVRFHANGIEPPSLGEIAMVEAGAHRYRDVCVQCHGAPGVQSQPFARAMRPEPPELTKAVEGWTSGQLFWIIKNGLKMSGMPAWQSIHGDDEIWALVAFLDQLPTMDAARYQLMTVPPPQPAPVPSEEDEVIPPSEDEEPSAEPAPVPPSETPPPPAPTPQ